MAKITAKDLPKFDGKTDVLSVKAWFEKLAALGGTFHADDSVFELVDENGDHLFDPKAAAIVSMAMTKILDGAQGWPDPSFIYELAGQGIFKVEQDYPGFILDRGVPAALRTGYVSLPGQELPTLIVEEYNEFVAIQFAPGQGRLSEATEIKVIPVSNVGFALATSSVVSGDMDYIDVSGAVLDHGRAVSVRSFDDLEDVIVAVTKQAATAPRA